MRKAVEKTRVLPLPCARLLSRVEAAAYVGVSPVTFDRMIADKVMPTAKRIYTRVFWDVRQIDLAIEDLPGGAEDAVLNPWDE